jgi:hypothetical protein
MPSHCASTKYGQRTVSRTRHARLTVTPRVLLHSCTVFDAITSPAAVTAAVTANAASAFGSDSSASPSRFPIPLRPRRRADAPSRSLPRLRSPRHSQASRLWSPRHSQVSSIRSAHSSVLPFYVSAHRIYASPLYTSFRSFDHVASSHRVTLSPPMLSSATLHSARRDVYMLHLVQSAIHG